MADPQIGTVLVPCLVIQYNNQQFIQGDQIVGQTLDVPCRNVIPDEIGYWGVPVKDDGVFEVIQWILMVDQKGLAVPPPTFDSFQAFRVRDKNSGNTWWIYGTQPQFISACSTCCGVAAIPMPGIDGQVVLSIAPCQLLCDITNSSGAYQAIMGIPNVLGPDTFFPFGSFNNTAFPTASGAGYATVALLLTYLNANYTNTGGSGALVWTASADGLTLIMTGGKKGDSVCVVIARIGPSS